MKRNLLFITVCLLAVMAMSCASNKTPVKNTSQERYVNSGIPKVVLDTIKNTPEDSLVGIGTARMATLNQSRTISATRARAELSRQMDVIVRDMVRDYTASSEVDHSAALAFQENITVQLSQSRLQGSSIVDEAEDDRGNYWTIVMLNKMGTVNEINQAVAAAKLRIPAMASFNAEDRMNAAFDRYFKDNQIGYSDRD
ncbi:MAG: hypothetical protein FWC19_09560 [Treponema sp.]|nr:hypothetical protein [Treponema sp.]MCL2273031.1 hypothetical protein [Treponema sp.]